MSPTELKMQPTIHFQKKRDILISVASSFRKCIMGCIFNSVGLIITREIINQHNELVVFAVE
jgi:hypothetical protein